MMAWSDASGVAGQVGWSWGAVVALPGRSDSLVHGSAPTGLPGPRPPSSGAWSRLLG